MKYVMGGVMLGMIAGCAQDPYSVEPTARIKPQTQQEVQFAKSTLDRWQGRSISENVEYCGYIGLNAAGRLIATDAKRGDNDTCQPNVPPQDMQLIASYHTHGASSQDYDSEVPSYSDLRADILEQVDGYIATPAGRVWFNDASEKRAKLLCDVKCITSDPNASRIPKTMVEKTYDLNELRDREDST